MDDESSISDCLVITDAKFASKSFEKRKLSIDEAISWDGGYDQKTKKDYKLYSTGKYDIVLRKPGKEAAIEYNRCKYKDGRMGNNPNDMTPTLFVDGQPHETRFSFDDIFDILNKIGKESETALELIGCLIFHSAYMLDHVEREPNKLRLVIPEQVLKEIEKEVTSIDNIPIRAFLYMMDAIALNEDVKYFTLGYNDNLKNGTGRRNNLLTYCNLVAVLLDRVSFVKFTAGFARPPTGISAITPKAAMDAFPILNGIDA
jgi:hypothetical protein